MLGDHLVNRYGENGCLGPDAGEWLKSLWRQGNGPDIFTFFTENGLGKLTAAPLMRRWQQLSQTSPPDPV